MSLGTGLFLLLVVLSTIATVFTALVPDTEKSLYRRTHRIAAYGLAVISYAMTVWIMLTPSLRYSLRLWAVFVVVFMTYCVVAYIGIPKIRRYYLIHQAAYILMFYSLLIALT